eukprot:scaffold118494_cov34-Tisochrysis_lutea.AAC.1
MQCLRPGRHAVEVANAAVRKFGLRPISVDARVVIGVLDNNKRPGGTTHQAEERYRQLLRAKAACGEPDSKAQLAGRGEGGLGHPATTVGGPPLCWITSAAQVLRCECPGLRVGAPCGLRPDADDERGEVMLHHHVCQPLHLRSGAVEDGGAGVLAGAKAVGLRHEERASLPPPPDAGLRLRHLRTEQ